jgi:hypothetical protein
MKKLALTIGLLAGATAGYSQGVINWTDYIAGSFYIEVFGGGTGGPGNTSSDIPAGSATYTGVPLGSTGSGSGPTGYGNGANYQVGLYEATTQAGVQALVLAGTPAALDNFTAGAGGWDFSGHLTGTTPDSGSVFVELAAWYSGGGAHSYAAAVVAGVPHGFSNSGNVTEVAVPGTPTANDTLATAGIQDFVIAVPEPSTVALGVVGASAFLRKPEH